jgi:Fe-S oxidoreductase
MNLRDALPGAARLSEAIAGFSSRRSLPKWRSEWFRDESSAAGSPSPASEGADQSRDAVLFVDTFNRYFEPENARAAIDVLRAAGCRVHLPKRQDRPLCCGRTFLSVGLVEEARREAEHTVAALIPYVDRGIPFLGLEPSCLYSFRDEIPALLKTSEARAVADQALLFEEYIAREAAAGAFALPARPIASRALLHGHCHQKSFGAMGAVEAALKIIPDLAVEPIASSCCGMAGAFGYAADTIDASLKMAELSLLPAVRSAPADALIVADGTSCRHQIADGSGREALHVARVLAMSLAAPGSRSQ